MNLRTAMGAGLTLTMIASLLVVSPASGIPTKKGVPQKPMQTRIVTLISGDQVVWHGGSKVEVLPRDGMHFMIEDRKEQLFVIPSDALPLLRANRLDKRLFDVKALAAADRGDTLPLIVTGGVGKGLTVTRKLSAVDGVAAKVAKKDLAGMWKSMAALRSNGKLWLDGIRRPTLDVSVPQIGAPAVWASGVDGAGVKVAVLDTGIDPTHPDMLGRIVARKNFGFEEEDDLDRVGHGTHVASTIAGNGPVYKGVAPGASLLDGKVCVLSGCAESWILDGMQWAADNGAQVVNLSLGGSDTPEIDPVEQAVNDLTASHGILFVIAAGNDGGDETIGSPGSADAALTVGAVTKQDDLADFSSRGPRIGDAALKPDITGPGVDIVAARSKDGEFGEPGQSYTSLSGTSMATPHVAGSAALLTQKHPTWTPSQRKAALMAAANPNASIGIFAQGAGRVDIARAINQTITTSPATVSLGRQLWPHTDDVPDARTVTYSNSGTQDVTLSLALSPANDMFTLSASTLEVPAGGTASVTLTSDTRAGGEATGYFGGHLTASAYGIQVQTPFAVEREAERFNVDLKHLDRAGQPDSSFWTTFIHRESGLWYDVLSNGEPDVRVRLPRGDYVVTSWSGIGEFVLLTMPKVTLDGDRTVTLDARVTRGYDVTMPDAKAKITGAILSFQFDGGTTGLITSRLDRLFTGSVGASDSTQSFLTALWRVPAESEEYAESKTTYHLGAHQAGGLFTGLTRHLKRADLARLEVRMAAGGGNFGSPHLFPRVGAAQGWGVGIFAPLPFVRAQYVTTETDWDSGFATYLVDETGWPESVSDFTGQRKSYVAGQSYGVQWNRAVFGPALPLPSQLGRDGDQIWVSVPLRGDDQNRGGFAWNGTYRTALYRDGVLIGEEPRDLAFFDGLPTGKSRYRVESTGEFAGSLTLSTKLHTVWEFDSAATDKDTALPITVFGLRPQLDQHNKAKASQLMVMPVDIRQQGGQRVLRAMTLEMSADDGAHWSRVPVVMGVALFANPANGYVSFRVRATDTGGNTVDQTVIRAYSIS